ncbi:protease complex subunit PrcB family protein [Candidatus Desantisbacteria bacterium]|nr:protease complex subunit PrcB family protein [Candidatus Desantisbacteria bacterium]
MKKFFFILIFIVFTFILSCMSKNTTESINFINIYQGFPFASGLTQAGEEIIKYDTSWTGFWKKFKQNTSDSTDIAPWIDFDKYMIAAIYLGEKDTVGYKIEIQKIETDGKRFKVQYQTTKPKGNCFKKNIYPVHIVKFIKKEIPVNFYPTIITTTCD